MFVVWKEGLKSSGDVSEEIWRVSRTPSTRILCHLGHKNIVSLIRSYSKMQ